jgi:H+/gluconate symporter-like permease
LQRPALAGGFFAFPKGVVMSAYGVELIGILIALGLLIFLAFRGFTLLLAAPTAAIVAAAFSGEPLLAKWTLTFMRGTGGFIINFFPLFLLGGVFGKLMDDSGAALSIARAITERLGETRAVIAVVLACAALTYGGVSLFVVAFAVFPVAAALFRQAEVPHRLIPPAIALGAFTFTMTALPGTPAIQNAIPMAYFGTTLFAAPVLGVLASAIILGFGLWWLHMMEMRARKAGEGYSSETQPSADEQFVRERAANADNFDHAELTHGHRSEELPPFALALAPILIVLAANLIMSLFVLPRVDTGFLAEPRFGTSLSSVSGVWSVVTALTVASLALVLMLHKRLPELRKTLDAGANASVLPVLNTASLVGFGAVVAALPAFAVVRDGFLAVPGGPLVSIAVAANVMGAITGSASGGLTIALNALGENYAQLAVAGDIHPELMHRVASISSGALAMLPHNGAVVTLLAICGATQRGSYREIMMVGLVGPLIALTAVIVLGKLFGSF